MNRNYILAAFIAFFAFAAFASGTAESFVAGLILAVVAYVIAFGRNLPGRRNPGAKSDRRTGFPTPVRTPSKANTKDTGQSGLHRLSSLDNYGRVAVTNELDVDESIEFALVSKSQAVVGTDHGLFFLPMGKRSIRDIVQVPYLDVKDARIEPRRKGNDLVIQTTNSWQRIPLLETSQIDTGLRILQDIRQRVKSAILAEAEEPADLDLSSLEATSSTHVPTSPASKALSLGDMLAMTPNEFEELTGRALEAMGYQDMKVHGGSGDLAADVVGRDPQGRSVIVQCKRYAPGNNVGSPAIQQFIGMKSVHHRADVGIYVTTADYSRQAIDLAKLHDIVLIDGDDLVKITSLILRPGVAPLPASRYCTSCGESLDSGAQFCANCGAPLAAPKS